MSLIKDIGICANIVDTVPTSVAERYKMYACDRYVVGVAGSNPAGSADMSHVSVVCCQVEFSASG